MAEKFFVAGDQHFSITGQLLEIQRQLRQKGGSPINPDLVMYALQDIIEGRFYPRMETSAPILKLLSGEENLLIDSCDGKAILRTAIKTFSSGINFGLWEIQGYSKPTEPITVDVYDILGKNTIKEIVNSLTDDLSKVCLTPQQIIQFCDKYPEWLAELPDLDCLTLFLFKNNDQFFIADVRVRSGLYLYVNGYSGDSIFDSRKIPHRLVVPKLNL